MFHFSTAIFNKQWFIPDSIFFEYGNI